MGNWRFGAFPKLPYSTMQQLNLDWILDRIRRFLPDTGTKGQVLTRTKDGAAWVDPEAASGAVSSVNGKTGAVILTASDVGALPSSYQAPVTSVNGMTGDVVIQAGGGAVDSVNGQTGDVVLTASDVGALPSSTVIPDSTSDLTNDSGFITAAQATAAAPVQSVNGKMGAVVLDADDVGALPNSIEIKIIHVDAPYSMPANGNAAVNIRQLIDAAMPAGYRFLGFSTYSTGYQRVFIINLNYADNNFSLYLSSMNSAAVSATFGCDVLITNLEE